MHDDHGQAGADGDDRLGLVGGRRSRSGCVLGLGRGPRVPERTDQCRGDEVDALDHEAGPLDDVDDAVDEVDVGGGDEHAAHAPALVVGVVGEDLRGQEGLFRREGDDLFGLEADGAVDLVVGHVGEVDLAGDGPEAGDADDHGRPGELSVLPELLDGLGHRGGVADLTVDQRAGRQADLAVGEEDGGGLGQVDLGGADTARTDVESDGQACHPVAPVISSSTGRRSLGPVTVHVGLCEVHRCRLRAVVIARFIGSLRSLVVLQCISWPRGPQWDYRKGGVRP